MKLTENLSSDIDTAYSEYFTNNPNADIYDLEAWIPNDRLEAVVKELLHNERVTDTPSQSKKISAFKTLLLPWGIAVQGWHESKIEVHPKGTYEAKVNQLRADVRKALEKVWRQS